ncbi:hypothetical protein V6B16_14820, partial [Salinimicrobium catena]|uniref:hypothetical protein n=1 Tax=Salinimicrobium catena TaxID=390640 RepID=UPI002FE444AD
PTILEMTNKEINDRINSVSNLSGTTVNERLYLTGLFDEFEKAMKSDKPKAVTILKTLKVDTESIAKILKANPRNI